MNEFERFEKAFTFDLDRVLFNVWSNPRVQNFIIELNTEGQPTSQLFEKGEDSLGVSLGEYSPFTVQLKVNKGQRIDHITLKDTGEFYESFDITPFRNGFLITANPIKDQDNLFVEYGEDIVGLSDQNKIILCESQIFREALIQEAKKALSQFR